MLLGFRMPHKKVGYFLFACSYLFAYNKEHTFLSGGISVVETIMVSVNRKIQRVSVLTAKHLKVYNLIENGTDITGLVKDRKMRRVVNDLCRLGWVKPRAFRH